MTSPPTSKQASRWGSLLSQAVAGVESRLDTILADGEEAPIKGSNDGKVARSNSRGPTSASAGSRADPSLSRTASTSSRKNERLQERLARAMVKREGAARPEGSPAPSTGPPSSTGTPGGPDSPRSSSDIKAPDDDDTGRAARRTSEEGLRASLGSDATHDKLSDLASSAGGHGPAQPPRISLSSNTPEKELSARPSMDSHSAFPSRRSVESARDAVESSNQLATKNAAVNGSAGPLRSVEEYEAMVEQMRSDHETAELRRQEETHSYMERIDALQTKLLYLSKEATESARNAASSAPVGAVTRKLAERDEQIALLMEEGQKLSKTELKHLTTIKKLRAAAKDEEKNAAETQKKMQRLEREASQSTERDKRAEGAERRANERLKAVPKLEKEVEVLKTERDNTISTVATLQSQLKQAIGRASEAEKRAQTGSLEAEKKLVIELRDDLSSANIEKELAEERARAEMREVKDRAEKDKERARVLEAELRGEQAMLESKMEVLRARLEEASTGATGDAQAKLLRQIETLQTQYAVASENWQGIEASLLSRVTNLEKEKDELTRREADMRRKARDINHKSKRVEDELETAKNRADALEQDLLESQNQLQKAERRVSDSNAALKDAHAVFAREKQDWEAQLAQRLEHERVRLRDELAAHPPRTASPAASSRRPPHPHASSSTDHLLLSLTTHRKPSTRPTSSSDNLPTPSGLPGPDRPFSRRPTPRQDSHLIPESPPALDDGDTLTPFDRLSRAPSLTTSTATPNPSSSVALLSHLSLSIRRLEAEKAAFVDDLARATAQLHEARDEVGRLMREVEEKSQLERRTQQVEDEMGQLRRRHEEALVMLGEKSEEVEELRGDVADLKGIYRELVGRMAEKEGG